MMGAGENMDYQTLFIELTILVALGLLYYFWQRARILRFEENKSQAVAAPLLQACLIEKDHQSFPLLEEFILALDDFLHGKSASFPSALAEQVRKDQHCPQDLAEIINESLKELDS